MQRNEQVSEFKEKLVAVNRVSKTVKGGRNMRFSALMVVGDEKGRIGCGMGKAVEIPEAIRKGTEDAKKNMVTISLVGTTIPHEVVGVYGTGRVLLMPAPEGTGLIAGGPVRQVLEAAGVKNIRTKSIGSNNPINMVKATLEGLKQLRNAEEIAKLRGKAIEELEGEGGHENEAENHADEIHQRVPEKADRHDRGAGPAQDRPDGRQAGQPRHPRHDLPGEAHGEG